MRTARPARIDHSKECTCTPRAECVRATALRRAGQWREHDAHRRAAGLQVPSRRRFLVLGGPGGRLSCRPAGDPEREDFHRGWVVLFSVNRPLTHERAHAAKGAALRCFEVR